MYTFNTNLRIGDIILVRGAAKHSKIIAKMTHGHFSHAMIALENDILLEAITGSGVQTTSMLRVSFSDKANVVVLRCLFPNAQTETNSLSYITKNFADYQGRKYSYKGAAGAIKESGGDNTNGGYFCSHLVAAIYSDAGYPLLKKPAYKITPNELLSSDVLEDVTDKVIAPYSGITLQRMEGKGNAINCIDAGGNTLSGDAKNHNQLLKDSAKYFTRNGLKPPLRCGDFPDILTDPMNRHFAKKLDYQISKAYKKIGINEFIRSEVNHSDFEEDHKTLISEIDQFGYEHAHDVYSSYNYLLITSCVKFLQLKTNLEYFQLFYDKWKFNYFSLKLEYISLTIEAISGVMEYYLDAIKCIEDIYPNKFEDLQETKMHVVQYVINKQVEEETKAGLIQLLRNLS
ncbi:hypothetical protein R7E79_21570 [Vibrio sp. Vb2135]|uniref:hypothetical protein n=1 Tax=Vibrio sp. Vb2135 TaxID=3074653 RepID=UPI002964467A|nr:hypothetical protein [Vibrio sp. Vb2135]MDW1764928.1 hypothetical protein [Vibrio sp. Vb2135]